MRPLFGVLATGFVAVTLLSGCDQTGGGAAAVPASQPGNSTSEAPQAGTAEDDSATGQAQGHSHSTSNGLVQPTGPAPPIEVSPAILDFGTLSPHQEVTGSVDLKNVGERPIRILRTISSCKCTAVDLSNVIIEPGESIPLEATFESGDNLGQRAAGVKVLLDGYQLLEVAIRADVTLPVKADPAFIDAQQVLVGQFNVTSIDGQPFRILAVNGDPPPFLGFDPQTDTPRNNYVLQWDFTEFDPRTCLNQYGERMPDFWVLETDHPDCGVLDLQIRHRCTVPQIPQDGRNWMLPGRRALLGELKPGEAGQFELTLVWKPHVSPDDTIYRVTSSNPEQFEAELVGDARRVGNDITCSVRITPNPAHRGLIYGTVLFHSSRHEAPYFVIGRVAD